MVDRNKYCYLIMSSNQMMRWLLTLPVLLGVGDELSWFWWCWFFFWVLLSFVLISGRSHQHILQYGTLSNQLHFQYQYLPALLAVITRCFGAVTSQNNFRILTQTRWEWWCCSTCYWGSIWRGSRCWAGSWYGRSVCYIFWVCFLLLSKIRCWISWCSGAGVWCTRAS